MAAVPFYHPQPQNNLAVVRAPRYTIPNSVGVIVEDTLIIATLIFGGIMGKFPELKVCIARSGGPTCFGMGQSDRGCQVRPEARTNISRPPSTYEGRFTTTASR